MGRTVQVRDVPENVHRKLKARAAESGISLSDYLRAELARMASLPTDEEMLARLRALPPLKEPKESPEEIVRKMRGPLP